MSGKIKDSNVKSRTIFKLYFYFLFSFVEFWYINTKIRSAWFAFMWCCQKHQDMTSLRGWIQKSRDTVAASSVWAQWRCDTLRPKSVWVGSRLDTAKCPIPKEHPRVSTLWHCPSVAENDRAWEASTDHQRLRVAPHDPPEAASDIACKDGGVAPWRLRWFSPTLHKIKTVGQSLPKELEPVIFSQAKTSKHVLTFDEKQVQIVLIKTIENYIASNKNSLKKFAFCIQVLGQWF